MSGPHEQVPRRGRLWDVLKRRFGIGRPRTSTVTLTMLFVAVLALWILVRPIPPDSTGATGAGHQTGRTTAPSYPDASAPANPTPTVTPSHSHSPRPSHTPTPTGSPTPHPSRSPGLGQSPSPTPTSPLQTVPATGSPSASAPVGGTAPAALTSPTP